MSERRPNRDGGSSLIRNAATSYGSRIVLALSALLLTPYLYRRLGVGGFGTWSVMFAVATSSILLATGFGSGVSKLVADLRAQDRRHELEQTVAGGVTAMAGLGLFAALLSAAFALLADDLAAAGQRGDFRTGMFVLAATMLVYLPSWAYGMTLIGYQRYDLVAVGWVAQILVFTVGAVVAVELGAGVLGVVIAYSASLVVEAVVLIALLVRNDPEMPLRPRAVSRGRLKRIAGFSSVTLFIDSMGFAGQRADTAVVAGIRSAAAAAPYASAIKLQSGLQALVLPYVDLMLPMVADLWSRDERVAVARRLRLATRVTLQLTLPVALVMVIFAGDIVHVWMGTAPRSAAAIVAVLAIAQVSLLACTPADRTLVGTGAVHVVGWIALFDGILNVALSIVLISSYGAVGAAIGTLATSALIAPVKLPIVCRSIGSSLGGLLRQGILPAIWLSAPGAVAMVIVRMTVAAGFGRLLLGAAVGLGMTALLTVREVGAGRLLAGVRSVAADRQVASVEARGPDPAKV
jgi:O-antigen/teichoic acid export membrane protein